MNAWMKRRIERSRARCQRAAASAHGQTTRRSPVKRFGASLLRLAARRSPLDSKHRR